MNILNRRSAGRCYVCIADPHSGHELGLTNPDTVLYSKNEHGDIAPYKIIMSPFQDWLWRDVYIPGVELVKKFAGSTPVTVFSLGDLTQGVKYDNGHYSLENQISIAERIFEPMQKSVQISEMYFVAGTGAHDPQAGSTVAVAERFQSKGVRAKPLYHLLLDDNGYEIDVTHHGPHPGTRSHLRGNVARYWLRDVMTREMKHRGRCASIYLRAHRHVVVDEQTHDGEHIARSRLVVCPPFTGINDFARQITNGDFYLTVGMFAFMVENGRMVDELWATKKLDVRTKL